MYLIKDWVGNTVFNDRVYPTRKEARERIISEVPQDYRRNYSIHPDKHQQIENPDKDKNK